MSVLLLLGDTSFAAVLEVELGGQYDSIGEAVAAAVDNDVIDVRPGIYEENVVIDKELDLVGADPGTTSIVSNGAEALTVISTTALITGFTINGNLTARPILISDSNVFLDDIVVVGEANQGPQPGAGMLVTAQSFVEMTNSSFVDSVTTGTRGGHIGVEGGTFVGVNLEFASATVNGEDGGAIFARDSSLWLTDSSFTNNAARDGGAIAAIDSAIIDVTNCTFEINHARGLAGGALQVVRAETLSVVDCDFIGNDAVQRGGHIAVSDSDFYATGSSFTDGESEISGGAVHAMGGAGFVRIEDCTFTDNAAINNGGAVHLDQVDDLTILRSEFCSNGVSAPSADGAAVHLSNVGLVQSVVGGSVFVGNVAADGGSALSCDGTSVVSAINNTVVGNDTRMDQGAFSVDEDCMAEVINNAIAYNSQAGVVGTTPIVAYNLFFGNVETWPPGIDGTNLELDPMFVDWTGSCDDDLSPRVGSPLIDAGDPSIVDLDGSRSDIGATGGSYGVMTASTPTETTDTDTTGTTDTGSTEVDTGTPVDDDTQSVPPSGCSCSSGGSLPGLVLASLGVALLAPRRTRPQR